MNQSRAIACLALLSVSAFAAGCASKTSAPLVAALAAVPAVPVPSVCDSAACKTQWERAQVWLAKHSLMKVQTATDVMVTTYGPTAKSFRYGFTVLREPSGAGQYKISLSMACGSDGMISCDPKPVDVQRAFYHYVRTGEDLLDGVGKLGGGIR